MRKDSQVLKLERRKSFLKVEAQVELEPKRKIFLPSFLPSPPDATTARDEIIYTKQKIFKGAARQLEDQFLRKYAK